MSSNCIFELEKQATRNLSRLPNYIRDKLLLWVDDVERIGIQKVRKIPGYHDEPLKGDRLGQRSIRLNKSYRAIYIERSNKEIIIISVIEGNKHDY